ncbi:MAG: hypothetical protein IPO72_00445 [Saprospiraceae bacterium]|nr:hypothetical protein [Candidatus Vicinibacter affinis]
MCPYTVSCILVFHLPIQYRAKEEVDGYYEEAQDSDETTVFEELKVLLGIS